MIDVEMVDKFFDVSLAMTGEPPGAFLFDRRFLMPFSRLPGAVQNETGRTVTDEDLHRFLEAGWFRRYEGAGEAEDELGVPLYVISRIGLFVDLRDELRYSDVELWDFAEYEDGFVETVLTSDELAYEDNDLCEVIRHIEEDLSHVELDLRRSERICDDADVQIIAPEPTRSERAELEKRKRGIERALGRYRSIEWDALPEEARLEISRLAYRIRCFNDVIRLMMIEQDRGRVRAGFGARMKLRDERFGLGIYEHGQVNWHATVHTSWFLENPERRLRVPGAIIEGLNVTLTGSPAPAEYDRLWREYDLRGSVEAHRRYPEAEDLPQLPDPTYGCRPAPNLLQRGVQALGQAEALPGPQPQGVGPGAVGILELHPRAPGRATMWVRAGDLIGAALDLEGPVYAPPYESPIEDAFAWHLVKHLDKAVAFDKQVEVSTTWGGFRLDFVATAVGRRIAFECDGAEYHNQLRDECRDAVILWAGHIDAVYRLAGADLHHRMGDVMATLATAEPALFSARGHRNVEHLARGTTVRPVGTSLFYAQRPVEEDERAAFPVRIERRSLESHFLRDFAQFASRRGGKLDDVISAFLSRAAGEIA